MSNETEDIDGNNVLAQALKQHVSILRVHNIPVDTIILLIRSVGRRIRIRYRGHTGLRVEHSLATKWP